MLRRLLSRVRIHALVIVSVVPCIMAVGAMGLYAFEPASGANGYFQLRFAVVERLSQPVGSNGRVPGRRQLIGQFLLEEPENVA
ncbi:hypothetical protein [Rhizobium binae]|uniref:hypothetical protein n=1 Tax=Rhizobium binae TaxID=1138190 RepID=UPI001FEDF005|nr:hypothetical protein [Rhizobium binae]